MFYPNFYASALLAVNTVSVAGANRDGSVGAVALVPAHTADQRIDRLAYKANGATTAGMIRFYHVRAGVRKLIPEGELSVLAVVTPSGTVATASGEVRFTDGFLLPAGDSIESQTNNAESFSTFAYGGKY